MLQIAFPGSAKHVANSCIFVSSALFYFILSDTTHKASDASDSTESMLCLYVEGLAKMRLSASPYIRPISNADLVLEGFTF